MGMTGHTILTIKMVRVVAVIGVIQGPRMTDLAETIIKIVPVGTGMGSRGGGKYDLL
jgi:hypothetical protein